MTLRGWLQPSVFALADGTTLTTSNLLATDGIAASAVTQGTGGTVKASTANLFGTALAVMRQISGTSPQQTRFPFAANTKAAVSWYRYSSALVASSVLFGIRDGSGALLFRMGFDGTGHFTIQTSGGAPLGTSAAAVTEARWNRYELVFDIGSSSTTGSATINIYNGNNTTPDVTLTVTGKNLGGTGSNTAAIFDHGFLVASNGSQQDVAFVRTNDGAMVEIGPYGSIVSVTMSDTAAATDTLTRSALHPSRTMTDVTSISETLTRTTSKTRTLTDSAPATDAMTRTFFVTRTLSDLAHAADTLARQQLTVSRSMIDSLGISDTLSGDTSQSRAMTDTAPASDVLTRSATVGARAMADTAPALDVLSQHITMSRSFSDIAGSADAPWGVAHSRLALMADTAPASDVLARTLALGRTMPDSAPTGDTLVRALHLGRTMTDVAHANDVITGMIIPPAAGSGRAVKVWNGSAWVDRPILVWTGTTWVEHTAKVEISPFAWE